MVIILYATISLSLFVTLMYVGYRAGVELDAADKELRK